MREFKISTLKNKLKIEICLALLLALICSSCSSDDSSKEISTIEQSGVFSEITESSENSEDVNSSNSEGNSEDVNSSNNESNSEDVNSSNNESNSEDINSSNNEGNSEDSNSSNNEGNSEDINSSNSEEYPSIDVNSDDSFDSEDVEKSEEASGEAVSKEHNSSEDSSEASKEISDQTSEETSDFEESKSEVENDSSDDYLIFDIPKEYENLDSYKALEKLGEEITDTVYIEMSTKAKHMNQDINMIVKSWESSKTDAMLTHSVCELNGAVISSQKELTVDSVKYIIDDEKKTYCVVPESEYLDIDELLEMGTIESVETKNELVGLEIYVADWFLLSDGSRIGFYTKDGALKYIGVSKTVLGQTTELVFKTIIRNDNSGVVFSIPEDYELVEYKF